MNQKDRIYIIVFSVLIHILLFLIWDGANFLNLFDSKIPEQIVSEPIVFDLQSNSKNKPKRVIETPKNAKIEKPKKAKLLSDKDSIAKNLKSKPDLKVDEAYSKGDYETYEVPIPQGMITPPPQKTIKPEKKKIEKDLRDYLPRNIEELLKKDVKKKIPPIKQGVSKMRRLVLHDNPLSKSLDRGGLSFNTYNWEFAPYMIMLKAKIQSNIFPPLAFTKLGIISGITLVKFRIYPDGKMEQLEVLGYKGHKSLMETSYNAIRISAPFPILPENFPEEYLEITGKFVYIIRGKK